MSEKKAKTRAALIERYYGKKDILASWEKRPPFSSMRLLREAPVSDIRYIRDLTRRVRSYQNDLAYRGVDGFSELAGGSADDHHAPIL